jgi:hypothetical protein
MVGNSTARESGNAVEKIERGFSQYINRFAA